MLLSAAVEKRCREGIEAALFGQAGSRFQTEAHAGWRRARASSSGVGASSAVAAMLSHQPFQGIHSSKIVVMMPRCSLSLGDSGSRHGTVNGPKDPPDVSGLYCLYTLCSWPPRGADGCSRARAGLSCVPLPRRGRGVAWNGGRRRERWPAVAAACMRCTAQAVFPLPVAATRRTRRRPRATCSWTAATAACW